MIEEKAYREMIERSLMSAGNCNRLKRVIAKARSNEPVTLAYIGGSITEGANTSNEQCYAALSAAEFGELFGGKINYVNAGMGGTPSALGVIRYKRDVLDKAGTLPDVVFVEFAVNDCDEVTDGKAFESLVRDILSAENKPAVILIFSVFKARWNMQDKYKPLGEMYGLPMISIFDALVPALDKDKIITDDEYFSDIFHPTTYGHRIMADCVKNLYISADKLPCTADTELPQTTLFGDDYCGIKMLDVRNGCDGVSLSSGGFSATDSEITVVQYDTSSNIFPVNLMHTAESGNEPFKLELSCKNMLFVYKESKIEDFGSAEIYVDGVLDRTVNSYNENGWNNSVTIKLFENAKAENHVIEVKMKAGDENKKFTIFTVGFTE